MRDNLIFCKQVGNQKNIFLIALDSGNPYSGKMASRSNRFWTVYLLDFGALGAYIGITRQVLAHRLSGHLYDALKKRREGPLQGLIAFLNLPLFECCEVRVVKFCFTIEDALRAEKSAIRFYAARRELLNESYYAVIKNQPFLL